MTSLHFFTDILIRGINQIATNRITTINKLWDRTRIPILVLPALISIGVLLGFIPYNIINKKDTVEQSDQNIKISFSSPSDENKNINCSIGQGGTYQFRINGTSDEVLKNNYSLLLWVKPVKPKSETPGWYLQKDLNGIDIINPDGSWEGTAQIGNTKFPPHLGDLLDINISVVNKDIGNTLLNTDGIIVRQKLPGVFNKSIKNVKVKTKE